MKEIFNDIFGGMLKKMPINFSVGVSWGFFTIILRGDMDTSNCVLICDNLLVTIINQNLWLFSVGVLAGFLYSNSLIKDLQILSLKKAMYRFPIVLLWVLAMFILGKH